MRKRSSFSPGRFNRVLMAAVCLLSCLAFAAPAQSLSQWRRLKPFEGGAVLALLESGGRVYAGTNIRGVFVSADGGKTWREANSGLGNLTINALAAAGGNVFAATNAGIYRSADGGQSWTLAGPGVLAMRSLLATGAGLFAGTPGGRVFRSTDNGASWVERGTVPTGPIIYALVALRENLFAGTFRGVFRSADQGQSWTASGAGLSNNGAPNVFSLAVSGATLYAGTNSAFEGGVSLPQVHSSGDNGQSWTAVGNRIRIPLTRNVVGVPIVNALSFDGTNIYAATSFGAVIYNGQEWTEWAGNRGVSLNAVVNTLLRGPTMTTTLLGTGAGIYALAGDGQSWAAGNTGLTAASAVALAVSSDAIIASAGASGLFRSGDDGQNWKTIIGVDNGNGRPFSVAALAVKGGSVFAGITSFGGAFRSNDNGMSWTQINNGFRFIGASVSDLAVGGEDVYGLSFGYLYKLNADGNGWTELTPSPINASRIAASGSNVYAAASSDVLRSTDGGANFAPVNAGTTITGSFAIAARGANVNFGAIANNVPRVFFSTNNGESFTPSQSSPRPTAFAFSGNTVFAAAGANGNGQGVAAAIVQRRNAAGQDSFEPAAFFDLSTNQFVARPIDLGPETDQVFLILFGTGFRFRGALSAVTARIGGTDAQVTFAGAQGTLAGLDQCNVRLPRSLAGRGDVEIVLAVEGKAANMVRAAVR